MHRVRASVHLMPLRRPLPGSAVSCRTTAPARDAALLRQYATRLHPLYRNPTGIRFTRAPGQGGASRQKWSSRTLILLATITGTTTYVIGLTAKGAPASDRVVSKYTEPTAAGFTLAMERISAEVLPRDCWSTDRSDLESHGFSSWSYHDPKALPGAILYPRSTEDVVAIVKLASLHSIPIIPYSGGTSLEGHCTAPRSPSNPAESSMGKKLSNGEKVPLSDVPGGLAWCLDFSENMGAIISINSDDLDVVVQPGCGYEALNSTLKDQGIPLFFPVDPAPGAQIGGLVGTGASGTNAVKYGTMRENVLNLTIVLPSGEVIKTRSRARKSSAGPNLTSLFIGSEGTLGIVVEATLKLHPVLPTSVAVVSFPSVLAAANTVRDLMQGGVGVACVELLDDVMIKAINAKNGAGARHKWEERPSLFLKFTGSPESMEGDIKRTRALAVKNGGSKNFIFATDAKDAEEIWYSRKIALWSALDYLPGSRCVTTDVCVPLSKITEMVSDIKEDIEREGIVGPIVAHLGDGNAHALLLYRDDEEFAKVEGIVHRMVVKAQQLGGTCTGEHGIGLGKLKYMEPELGVGTVDLLRGIKQIVDPQGIMNPGKLIPEKK